MHSLQSPLPARPPKFLTCLHQAHGLALLLPPLRQGLRRLLSRSASCHRGWRSLIASGWSRENAPSGSDGDDGGGGNGWMLSDCCGWKRLEGRSRREVALERSGGRVGSGTGRAEADVAQGADEVSQGTSLADLREEREGSRRGEVGRRMFT